MARATARTHVAQAAPRDDKAQVFDGSRATRRGHGRGPGWVAAVVRAPNTRDAATTVWDRFGSAAGGRRDALRGRSTRRQAGPDSFLRAAESMRYRRGGGVLSRLYGRAKSRRSGGHQPTAGVLCRLLRRHGADVVVTDLRQLLWGMTGDDHRGRSSSPNRGRPARPSST